MKKYILLPLLVIGISTAAQLPLETIKKHRIHSYQEYRGEKDAGDERHSIATWWFDSKGNDSLVYRYYDTLLPVYTYKNGKLLKRTYANPKGKEKERYDYEYKTDGSYMITYTDGSYSMKSYEWYDNKNRILKSQSPDGNTITYKYDAKGKLLLVSSDGKNAGVKLHKKYMYNAKGQLSKMEYKRDENSSVITYEYNTKGQLIGEKEKGKEGGEEYVRTTTWEYNEKGLVSRKRTNKNEDSEDWERISETFSYTYF